MLPRSLMEIASVLGHCSRRVMHLRAFAKGRLGLKRGKRNWRSSFGRKNVRERDKTRSYFKKNERSVSENLTSKAREVKRPTTTKTRRIEEEYV